MTLHRPTSTRWQIAIAMVLVAIVLAGAWVLFS